MATKTRKTTTRKPAAKKITKRSKPAPKPTPKPEPRELFVEDFWAERQTTNFTVLKPVPSDKGYHPVFHEGATKVYALTAEGFEVGKRYRIVCTEILD
jgi:hypothetical protein